MLKTPKPASSDNQSGSKRRVKLFNMHKDSGTKANQASLVRYSYMPPNSTVTRNDDNTLSDHVVTVPQSAGIPVGDPEKEFEKVKGRLIVS